MKGQSVSQSRDFWTLSQDFFLGYHAASRSPRKRTPAGAGVLKLKPVCREEAHGKPQNAHLECSKSKATQLNAPFSDFPVACCGVSLILYSTFRLIFLFFLHSVPFFSFFIPLFSQVRWLFFHSFHLSLFSQVRWLFFHSFHLSLSLSLQPVRWLFFTHSISLSLSLSSATTPSPQISPW